MLSFISKFYNCVFMMNLLVDNGSFLAINIHLWLTIKMLAVMVFIDLN